jgi:putative ABC transport system permease protein
MIRNYFVTTIRSFKRNISYMTLNILGLALGIGCALVIYRVITYERSFDTHHNNFENIYRVVAEDRQPTGVVHNSGVPHPMGDAILADYGFIEKVVKVDYQYGAILASWDGDNMIKRLNEDQGIAFANPAFFETFTFDPISGNLAEGVKDLNTAVISDEWAMKYFEVDESGLESTIGKRITLNSKLSVIIKGIFKAPPKNSDFPFQIVVHYQNLKDMNDYYNDGIRWNSTSSSTNCYVLIKNSSEKDQLDALFPDLIKKYFGEDDEGKTSYYLQPLSDIHFNSEFYNYGDKTTDERLLMALAIIGLFLIFTACINFTNLATAQAVKRSKEIGIRKVMGGHRSQLLFQFMSETLLITFISALFSLAVAELFLLSLEDILGYRLELNLFSNPGMLLFLIATVLIVTFLAGFYPAMILSKLNPVLAIKNKITADRHTGGLSLRRSLVVIQFAISQALIICTIVVLMQMRYVQSRPLGFTKDAILTTYIPEQDNPQALETMQNRLLAISGIEDITFCLGAPQSGGNSHSNFSYPDGGITENYSANFKIADERYIDFYEFNLLAGRSIRPSDSLKAGVINEQVMKIMGITDPYEAIGKTLETGFNGGDMEVVGVIKDFHALSMKSELVPIMIVYAPFAFYEMDVKFSTTGDAIAKIDNIIKEVDQVWSETYPEFIFDYEFLDQQIEDRYETEKNLSKLFLIFSGIAIFIGGLGLYGLISFLANQRVKEIGVRKVLGATMMEILLLFSKEILLLMCIAFAIAAPIAYWVMQGWLEDFAYSTTISPLFLVISLFISLFIALASTSYRSVLAANANPVESLRSE